MWADAIDGCLSKTWLSGSGSQTYLNYQLDGLQTAESCRASSSSGAQMIEVLGHGMLHIEATLRSVCGLHMHTSEGHGLFNALHLTEVSLNRCYGWV